MSYVVKVGGSLIPQHLTRLCQVFRQGGNRHNLILVAGGGQIADVLRGYTKQVQIDNQSLYNMALHSMDQHGIIMSSVGNFPTFQSLDELEKSPPVCCSVYLPSADFLSHPQLATFHIDQLTSDTIAAWVALRLGFNLIKVTDVDGIFDSDPRVCDAAKLLPNARASSLSQPNCIDAEAVRFIDQHGLQVFVVNGIHPERITEYLLGQPTIGTQIQP